MKRWNSPHTHRYLSFLLFTSGFASVCIQLSFIKILENILGSTVFSSSVILFSFSVGLGLASYISVFFDKIKPFILISISETLVGLFTIIVTLDIYFFNFYETLFTPHIVLSLYITIISFFMGIALPKLSSIQSDTVAKNWSFNLAYNSFGAALACIVFGFFLVYYFGILQSLIASAIVQIIIGSCFLYLHIKKLNHEKPEKPHNKKFSFFLDTYKKNDALQNPSQKLGLPDAALFFLVGFITFSLEILAIRVFIPIVGISSVVISIIFFCFILALAFGYYTHGIIRKSFDISAETILLLNSLVILFLTLNFNNLAGLYWRFSSFFEFKFEYTVLSTILFLLISVFPLAFFQGLSLPSIINKYSHFISSQTPPVVYSLSCIGNAIACILIPVFLIPKFGIKNSFLILCSLNFILLIAVSIKFNSRAFKKLNLILTPLMLLAIFFSFKLKLNKQYIASGLYYHLLEKNSASLQNYFRATEAIFYKEGVHANVLVEKNKLTQHQSLKINGKPVMSSYFADQKLVYFLSLLPSMIQKNNLNHSLILGLGTGISCATSTQLSKNPSCVEIEKAVIDALPFFNFFNGGLHKNKKVNIAVDDGRAYLKKSRLKYDLISSDPIHPWSSGSARLYTQEYFTLVASKLTKKGVASQWLPLYELSPQTVQSIIKTFSNSFEFSSLWISDFDIILLGSATPIQPRLKNIQTFIDPAFKDTVNSLLYGEINLLVQGFINIAELDLATKDSLKVYKDNNLHLELDAYKDFFKKGTTTENLSYFLKAKLNSKENWNNPQLNNAFRDIIQYNIHKAGNKLTHSIKKNILINCQNCKILN